ncbi:MAG: hypothetical protein AAGE38_11050 [Pseudomonadota bacterium]
MVPLRLDHSAEAVPEQQPSPDAMGFLNLLRFIAMSCRAKPRADLFEACALLQIDRSVSQEVHAEALMRCLNEALGKPARLYSPGVAEMTFDESWLVQLGLASVKGDKSSFNFLLKSRVSHKHQRLVSFLVHRISNYMTPD